MVEPLCLHLDRPWIRDRDEIDAEFGGGLDDLGRGAIATEKSSTTVARQSSYCRVTVIILSNKTNRSYASISEKVN